MKETKALPGQTPSYAAGRRVQPECPSCGDSMFAPAWSEYLDQRRVRHHWNCESCGLEFETLVKLADAPVVRALSSDKLPNVPAVRAKARALSELTRHGYSEKEISTFVVSKRTLARRKGSNRTLTVEETDKALRLERIAELAKRVFGDPQKAYRWLRQPKNALNGATPLEYLASEGGARNVEDLLHRIEHGIFG